MHAYFTTPKVTLLAVAAELMVAAKRDQAPVPIFEIESGKHDTRVSCDNVHAVMQFIGRVADNGEDGLLMVLR